MRSPDWGRETKRSAGGNVKTLIVTIITIIKIFIFRTKGALRRPMTYV